MSSSSSTHRIIEAHSLYSLFLDEERTIKVFIPPHFNPEVEYPVLYCHDGTEFLTHGRIATIAHNLITEKQLEPFLIVHIPVSHAHRTDDYSLNGSRQEAYLQFVKEECIPLIERTYPVSTTAEGRFMAGISLGAVVTLELYLRDPQYINKLLLFSGAYYEDVQKRIQTVTDLSQLHAFMVVGKQETEVKAGQETYDFLHANQQVRDYFVNAGADVAYTEADGLHLWGFWQSQIPNGLNWLQRHRA